MVGLISFNYVTRNYYFYSSPLYAVLLYPTIALSSNLLPLRRKGRAHSARHSKKAVALLLAISAPVTIAAKHTDILGLSFKKVAGSSMLPSLQEGQWIILDHWGYKVASPQQGDIVVYTPNNNSNRLSIKRIHTIDTRTSRYQLLGENCRSSYDSRHHGMVNRNQIKGKALTLPPTPHPKQSSTEALCPAPNNPA
jgi:nickel-type superoxide dismutase maturation protease